MELEEWLVNNEDHLTHTCTRDRKYVGASMLYTGGAGSLHIIIINYTATARVANLVPRAVLNLWAPPTYLDPVFCGDNLLASIDSFNRKPPRTPPVLPPLQLYTTSMKGILKVRRAWAAAEVQHLPYSDLVQVCITLCNHSTYKSRNGIFFISLNRSTSAWVDDDSTWGLNTFLLEKTLPNNYWWQIIENEFLELQSAWKTGPEQRWKIQYLQCVTYPHSDM